MQQRQPRLPMKKSASKFRFGLQRQGTNDPTQFVTSKRVPSCNRSRPGRTAGRNKGTVHKGSNHTGNSTAAGASALPTTAPVTTPAATAPGNHQPHQAFALLDVAIAVAPMVAVARRSWSEIFLIAITSTTGCVQHPSPRLLTPSKRCGAECGHLQASISPHEEFRRTIAPQFRHGRISCS